MKKLNKIVFIGAGNLATHLAQVFFDKGLIISQIYSRTDISAQDLANKVEANYTSSLADIDKEADLYVCAVKDDVMLSVLPFLLGVKGIVVHAAGSVDMSIFEGTVSNYGVFYLLQTFSKNRSVDFKKIPVFLEANNVETLDSLKELAIQLSDNVQEANSEQRKKLHLSAIFASNFTNHMYVLANEIVEKAGFDFSVLQPLIDETAAKVAQIKPIAAQTGPAVRFDQTVMDEHLGLLSDNKKKQLIYQLLSEDIYIMQNKKKQE
jgi:predicted short-subunit dehydrogenase-like oxidoreductase (DUF2520 family)